MINFSKIVKGITFLVCLGFLVCAYEANAATPNCGEGMTWSEEFNSCMLPEVEVTAKRCGTLKSSMADGSGDTYGIFNYLACKITTVVADVRAIVYILAGFGMIAFAYGAIIGKINFKQLANIGIGLFILSMTTGIIEAFVFNDGTSRLQFGNFLPNGNHAQFNVVKADCAKDPKLCPDAQLADMKKEAEDSKWSFKDLKSSIKSAKDAIKTASDTYKTVKSAVDTGVQAAKRINNAIKNGGSITQIASEVVAGVNQAVQAGNLAATTLSGAAVSLSGDLKGMSQSTQQKEYLAALEKEYSILKGKCDTGNCSANEKASLAKLAADVDASKTKFQKDLEKAGSTVTKYSQKAANLTQNANKVTANVSKAENEGRGMFGGKGGDGLAAAFAITEAVTSTGDYIKENKDNLDFRSEKKKAADKLAEEEAQCKKQGWSWVNGECIDPDVY